MMGLGAIMGGMKGGSARDSAPIPQQPMQGGLGRGMYGWGGKQPQMGIPPMMGQPGGMPGQGPMTQPPQQPMQPMMPQQGMGGMMNPAMLQMLQQRFAQAPYGGRGGYLGAMG